VKNRLQLDFRPDDQDREVDRLLALGASRVDIGKRVLRARPALNVVKVGGNPRSPPPSSATGYTCEKWLRPSLSRQMGILATLGSRAQREDADVVKSRD
jgi:hypothetical protein